MKFLSISFSFAQHFPTHQKLSDFFPISQLGGDHFRIIILESHLDLDLIEDSQKKKKLLVTLTVVLQK